MRQASERIERGTVLDDRYEIEAIVGSGGFSTVYRARQKPVERPVAVKVLEVDEEGGSTKFDEVLERFRREAKVVARLESPSTVELYDFGQSRDGDVYMVLEYVDGTPLSRVRDLPMAPNRVVRILEQTLDSLAEAHDHGVLHRDIKPSNLMLHEVRGEEDRLKVLDFGVAKLLRADQEVSQQLTRQDAIVGTPRYLAPELATKNDPGPASDVYSLGLVAYELLVGEKAVDGQGAMSILGNHLDADFQAELPEGLGISDRLRGVVNRMIRKAPTERYDTAGAVLADLAGVPDGGRAVDRPAEEGGDESYWDESGRDETVREVPDPAVGGPTPSETTEQQVEPASTASMESPPNEDAGEAGVQTGETSTEKNRAVETESDEVPATAALEWDDVDVPEREAGAGSAAGDGAGGKTASLEEFGDETTRGDEDDRAAKGETDESDETDRESASARDASTGRVDGGPSWETALEGGETGENRVDAEGSESPASVADEGPEDSTAMTVVIVTATGLLAVFVVLVVLIVLTLMG